MPDKNIVKGCKVINPPPAQASCKGIAPSSSFASKLAPLANKNCSIVYLVITLTKQYPYQNQQTK